LKGGTRTTQGTKGRDRTLKGRFQWQIISTAGEKKNKKTENRKE
jgi:hypothetical protein